MKNKKQLVGIVFPLILIIFGCALSNDINQFLNFLIMPLAAAIAYCLAGKKYMLVLPSIFAVSYFVLLIMSIVENGFSASMLLYPLTYSTIYTLLGVSGIVIAALLRFAFKKEIHE